MMSPQLTSCQVGSRGSSADGFRRAELAQREPGWILLRQPGPRQREVGRTDLGPSRARLRIPVPSRLAPFQAGSTRSSGNPRERTSTRELVT